MTIVFDSVKAIDQVVEELLIYANGRKKMTFVGEIGAGKTTFIQAFCRKLGVKESVTSPTFSLINEYTYVESPSNQQRFVHHMDLYRLKTVEEALDIGIEDYLFGDNYCLIEWPEIIEPLLPANTLKINIEILENSSRKIIFL